MEYNHDQVGGAQKTMEVISGGKALIQRESEGEKGKIRRKTSKREATEMDAKKKRIFKVVLIF